MWRNTAAFAASLSDDYQSFFRTSSLSRISSDGHGYLTDIRIRLDCIAVMLEVMLLYYFFTCRILSTGNIYVVLPYKLSWQCYNKTPSKLLNTSYNMVWTFDLSKTGRTYVNYFSHHVKNDINMTIEQDNVCWVCQ